LECKVSLNITKLMYLSGPEAARQQTAAPGWENRDCGCHFHKGLQLSRAVPSIHIGTKLTAWNHENLGTGRQVKKGKESQFVFSAYEIM